MSPMIIVPAVDAGGALPTLTAQVSTSGTSFTNIAAKLSASSAGDILVLFVSTYNKTVSPPSGWSLVTGYTSGVGLLAFTKVSTGSEPSTVTITGSNGENAMNSWCLTFSGASSVAQSANTGSVSGTAHATPTITTAVPTLIVRAAGTLTISSGNYTWPAGPTSLGKSISAGYSGSYAMMTVAWSEMPTPGASGSVTATASSVTGYGWSAITLAIAGAS